MSKGGSLTPGGGRHRLVEFRVGDVQDLPFDTGSFDVVMGEFITVLPRD